MAVEILSFLQSRALIKRAFMLPVMLLVAGNFFYSPAFAASSEPFDETVRILERWTAAHWGQDCFVWVVHYPEELTDSWVEAEALRANMTETERENFRKNFISELKLDSAETFLVSVYSFGMRPVNVSPVSENITLLAASGERIKPTKYDSALDYPAGGVVQGLVFFPKQTNKDYVIALKGMSQNERIFSFAPPEAPAPVEKEKKKSDVVVMTLPKRSPKKKAEPEKEFTPPPPPAIPARTVKPLFAENETSQDMADFVNSIRERGNASKDAAPKTASQSNSRPSNIDSAYSSRETVLRKFLSLWADLDAVAMYDMLSEDSQKNISRENFAKRVAKASDFRASLKKGKFRIDWVGEERAKVIVTQRALFIKSLISKTLGVTREGSSWKIVWD
ncbi:MAG: hypothetical protein IJP53_05295 [Synergistaceae bacterium]|nr:hypothetical protein [Synergistaceae bacterium]